jgi:hypothetical protein
VGKWLVQLLLVVERCGERRSSASTVAAG